ncbi:SMI1/KNR4 family protein [Hymenobacter sp. UV11]|uniref:SMI1/KNR4 family protein n=1 Tax=Hymenobacter sp. UV11 TaxID=1849735 RepID=UPI00141503AB|nr:SMI1/KNR4 family protein [Hymenobacter sp. UV11]
MKPKIKNIYALINSSQVIAVENNLGITLPVDYKHFLIETNGGEPLYHLVKTISGGEEAVGWFLGIHGASGSLLSIYQQYSRHLPKGALPIAVDPFGNLFCIATDKFNYGKIFFWQHESTPQTHLSIKDSNCVLVAPDFEYFVNSFIEN